MPKRHVKLTVGRPRAHRRTTMPQRTKRRHVKLTVGRPRASRRTSYGASPPGRVPIWAWFLVAGGAALMFAGQTAVVGLVTNYIDRRSFAQMMNGILPGAIAGVVIAFINQAVQVIKYAIGAQGLTDANKQKARGLHQKFNARVASAKACAAAGGKPQSDGTCTMPSVPSGGTPAGGTPPGGTITAPASGDDGDDGDDGNTGLLIGGLAIAALILDGKKGR